MKEIAEEKTILFEWGHVLQLNAKLTFADASKHIHFGEEKLRDSANLFYTRKGSPIEDYLRNILLTCKHAGLDLYWEERGVLTLRVKYGIKYVNAEEVSDDELNLYHLSLFFYAECVMLTLTFVVLLLELFYNKINK